MKKLAYCPHCGRKLAGTGHDEDYSVSEMFCYFCEAQLVSFRKRKKIKKR